MYKLVCFTANSGTLVYEREFGHKADLEKYLIDELITDMDEKDSYKYEAYERSGWQPVQVTVNISVTI